MRPYFRNQQQFKPTGHIVARVFIITKFHFALIFSNVKIKMNKRDNLPNTFCTMIMNELK